MSGNPFAEERIHSQVKLGEYVEDIDQIIKQSRRKGKKISPKALQLRYLRLKNELIQKDVAKISGYTQQAVCRMELGEQEIPEGFYLQMLRYYWNHDMEFRQSMRLKYAASQGRHLAPPVGDDW